jgi:hypothetical protein
MGYSGISPDPPFPSGPDVQMGIASKPLTSVDLKVAQMRQSHVFENETPFRSFRNAAIRVTKEAGETADHQTVATASFFLLPSWEPGSRKKRFDSLPRTLRVKHALEKLRAWGLLDN